MERSPHRTGGRHGIGPRRPTSAPGPEPSAEPTPRPTPAIVDRPPPSRTHPRRHAATLARAEGGTDPFHLPTTSAPAPETQAAVSDAASVVPEAYRVIDQYVEDGQKAAHNWTHAGEGSPPDPEGAELDEREERRHRRAHAGPAADHLITEAISALVSTRGLNSAASALPAILAGLAPGSALPNALEVLIDAAQLLLDGDPGRGRRRGHGRSRPTAAHPELADLWEQIGVDRPVDPEPDHGAPMSTTGWLPDSHEG